MPHRCMDCKSVIESGTLDLKQGCPACGCKKFQYVRPSRKAAPAAAGSEPATPAHKPAGTAGKPASAPAEEGPRIESVRIVEPGTYDINLPLLLSRKELVMSKEEGDYYVDLKSALKPAKKKKHS